MFEHILQGNAKLERCLLYLNFAILHRRASFVLPKAIFQQGCLSCMQLWPALGSDQPVESPLQALKAQSPKHCQNQNHEEQEC
eukprot:Skav224385  [mRNA]  locus=scaffold1155:287762:288010:- [translate_table: standard]